MLSMRRNVFCHILRLLKIRSTGSIVDRQGAAQNHTYRCSTGSCRQTLPGPAEKHKYRCSTASCRQTLPGAAQKHMYRCSTASQTDSSRDSTKAHIQVQHRLLQTDTFWGSTKAQVQVQHRLLQTDTFRGSTKAHVQEQHRLLKTNTSRNSTKAHVQVQHRLLQTDTSRGSTKAHVQVQHRLDFQVQHKALAYRQVQVQHRRLQTYISRCNKSCCMSDSSWDSKCMNRHLQAQGQHRLLCSRQVQGQDRLLQNRNVQVAQSAVEQTCPGLAHAGCCCRKDTSVVSHPTFLAHTPASVKCFQRRLIMHNHFFIACSACLTILFSAHSARICDFLARTQHEPKIQNGAYQHQSSK